VLTCRVDLSEFHAAVTATKRELGATVRRSTMQAGASGRDEAKAKGQFQDRTGNLRREIFWRILTYDAQQAEGEIVSPMSYSQFVENPTRPHKIVARRKPELVFWWPKVGAMFFGKSVNHPGTRGYPFMGPAYLRAESKLYAEVDAGLARVSAIWR